MNDGNSLSQRASSVKNINGFLQLGINLSGETEGPRLGPLARNNGGRSWRGDYRIYTQAGYL